MSMAPGGLLSAYAVDTTSNPFWATPNRGAIRVLPNPRLGFPLGPFGVFRGPYYRDLDHADVRWYPRRSTTLPARIDGELWGTLVTGSANPDPPLVVMYGCNADVLELASMSPQGLPRARRTGSLSPAPENETNLHALSSIRLGAPSIRTIRLSASAGHLTHLFVAQPDVESMAEAIGQLGLPLGTVDGPNGVVYQGHDDGEAEAFARVRNDAPGAYPPFVTPVPLGDPDRPSPDADAEQKRVQVMVDRDVRRMLKDHLSRVGEGTVAPKQVTGLAAYAKDTTGTLDEYGALWIASADPGIGRWLGLMGAFEPIDSERPTVVTVAGIWVLPDDHPDLAVARAASDREIVNRIMRENGLDDVVGLALDHEGQGRNVVWLWTQAFAPPTLANELPEVPAAPILPAPSGAWGRSAGQDVYRVTHTVLNPVPLGTLGVTRDVEGSGPVPIQPPVEGVDFSFRPLMVTPGTAFLDSQIDPDPGACSWAVWQADAFGRWSEAPGTTGMTIARPDLPIPHPMARMLPDLGAHQGGDPYSAPFEVTIPVPERVPGGVGIGQVELVIPWVSPDALTMAAAPQVVYSGLTGVPTTPATTAHASIHASFVGNDGTRSEGGSVELTFNDPRPPVPIPPPPILRFTLRGDATGTAVAHVPLPGGEGIHGYRVFYTNEARVRSLLGNGGVPLPPPGAIRDDRANAWMAIIDQVPRVAFDALTVGATVPPGEFLHQLSGTLEQISFYRIVPVSATGAEAPFSQCPVIPFAVPYPAQPTRPRVWTTRRGERTTLHIQALPGSARAIRWRVRAAKAGVDDSRGAEVIGTGSFDDQGLASFAIPAMRPFASVVLSVEVQGEDEIGVPNQPGLWSAPSRRLDVMFVPKVPPALVTSATGDHVDGNLVVHLELDQGLVPEAPEMFRVRLYSMEHSTTAPRLILEDALRHQLSMPLVAGAEHFVVLVDPKGRMSPRIHVAINH